MNFENKLAIVNFETKNEIGQHGRNSKVFLAHDKNLNATIVIKKIKKSSFNDPSSYFEEARALYKSNHPYVVKVLYACEDLATQEDPSLYIAMPFYKNKSLKDLLNEKKLTVREIIKYSTEFLSGLNHIHMNKFIHFDIKPDNIMLSDRMECLISDFGLTKPVDELGLAEPNMLYIKRCPPEYFQVKIAQAKGEVDKIEFDRLFDIYQVGLTLYCMCCGDNKVLDDQLDNNNIYELSELYEAMRAKKYPDLSLLPEHIPQKLKKIIQKCTSFDPNDRFVSAIDIINSFADIDVNCVDWEYSVNDNNKQWTKQDSSGNIHNLYVDDSGKSTATKKIKKSGNTIRDKKYCLEQMDPKSFKDYLFGKK